MQRKKVVLGAGIAGLGVYHADPSAEIYEASDGAGGLCSGFSVGDFYFDRAVHLSFSKDPLVREIFDRTPQYTHIPSPYSFVHGTWLRHPAQNNLYPLPPGEKVEAVKGFLKRKGRGRDTGSFARWLLDGYGEYLYGMVFKPYNEKYWCTDLEGMGTAWIGDRIYQPTLDEVLLGTYMGETPNTYYAKKMYYPIGGGYFQYLKGMVGEAMSRGKLHLYKKAVRVDPVGRMVYFADGTKTQYDGLYSSIPLPELLRMVDGVPKGILGKGEGLEHTGVALVSMGLRGCRVGKLWFYIHDADIMAARAYMPSVKSRVNAPDGCASIQFEIYFNGRHGGAPGEGAAVADCLAALEKLGVAGRGDVLFTDYRVLPYGNIIGLKQTEKDLPGILSWLKEVGITPVGRFGRWEYLWSDQAFLSGYHAGIEGKG